MQEICQSGSEGGAKLTFVPTPIREKWTRPGGTVDLLASPRDLFRRTLRRALLETYHRDKARGALGPLGGTRSPETEERTMTHLQETLINRPYGTGRVFFLFSRHFVPGYPRFNPSGINA